MTSKRIHTPSKQLSLLIGHKCLKPLVVTSEIYIRVRTDNPVGSQDTIFQSEPKVEEENTETEGQNEEWEVIEAENEEEKFESVEGDEEYGQDEEDDEDEDNDLILMWRDWAVVTDMVPDVD